MKKATMMRGLAAAMMFASLSPIACGSDSGSKGTTAPDKTSTPQDAGPPPAAIPAGSVACGSKICTPPTGSMACCANAFESICGIVPAFGGGCGKAPPPPPPECPTLPSLGPITLQGCCTDKGECGVDGAMIGQGCNNYADTMTTLMMLTGGMGGGGMASMFSITLPAEASCTPPAAN